MITHAAISTPAPLHVWSGYSLMRGGTALSRVIDSAAAMEHHAVALTDVNNLYGVTFFWKQAIAKGLTPIVGAHLLEEGLSVVALVDSDRGYENLCRILTRLQVRQSPYDDAPGKFPRPQGAAAAAPARAQVPPSSSSFELGGAASSRESLLADLAELSEGLQLLVEDAAAARALLAVPRGQLWLAVDAATQTHAQMLGLLQVATEARLPLVASGKALMAAGADLEAARLLAAIRTGSTFDTVAACELPNPRAILRSPEQLRQQVGQMQAMYGLPARAGGEAAQRLDAVANNERIVERCRDFKLLPRRPVFPDFPCPGEFGNPAQFLRHLCQEGLWRRYSGDVPAGADERLDRELERIGRMGFTEYFLVVWDIVQYARRQGAPVAGRGSGASSLVAYLLGITNVCPLAYDIPFERFLSEYRTDFPDLDVDFCWRIRDDVIAYAFKRWGASHVAMVSMHTGFQQRSAVRETAKALGMSNEQITEMVDAGEARGGAVGSELDAPSQSPHHAAARGGRARQSPQARIGLLANKILGLPHVISVHPGGIVIGRKPIDCYVPLQPAAKGVMIAQLDKNGVEDINLVKLDLLGNRNLSTIRYATDLIRRRRKISIDVESLPADAATVEMLQRADTIGCNQLESPAMRHLLKMMQVRGPADVMKLLALIRPGAASIGMKEVFVRRHRGLDPIPGAPQVPPASADANPVTAQVCQVLRNSCGVMLYEDDVMLVAAAMLGKNLDEADRFRKAVQKCGDDRARLELSRQFLGACQAHGADAEFAKSMWVQMAKFNAYSFCRAHAASYAVLAYAGAYLKTHYPLEFWVSCLNNNQSMYPTRCYVEQAKREGVRFLLPDANLSHEEFAIEDEEGIDDSPFTIGDWSGDGDGQGSGGQPACRTGRSQTAGQSPKQSPNEFPNGGAGQSSIRVGLNRIAGLGPSHVGAILQERSAHGPFESLSEFLARTHLGRQEARAMILCGAFDFTRRRRPALMLELELFLSTKLGRFWQGQSLLSIAPAMPVVPGDYEPLQKYMQERQILGLGVGEHLVSLFRPLLSGQTTLDSRGVRPHLAGRRVRIAGVLEASRTNLTQSGQPMMFLTMDDEHGIFEVTLFPDALRRCRLDLAQYGPYVIHGTLEEQYGAVTVSAQSIELLANVAEMNIDECK